MSSLSASAEALFLGPDHVVALALNAMLLLFQALSCSGVLTMVGLLLRLAELGENKYFKVIY